MVVKNACDGYLCLKRIRNGITLGETKQCLLAGKMYYLSD